MPDERQSEPTFVNKSHIQVSQPIAGSKPGPSRRNSSNIALRSHNRSSSPSRESKAPLTPEESPLVKSTKKRSADSAEADDKILTDSEVSPGHSRASSGDPAVHVCICQPDPKIPRPRNAFILYRQHHQAGVVAQNPGLANPQISKIIGERWHSLSEEERGKWKALADEEKLRHQQQYPTYRYQPKRNGRRGSVSADTPGSAGDKPKCSKCGGRTTITPLSSLTTDYGSSVPPTPASSVITPVTRTLPILRDLSLQSPASRLGRQHSTNMSPHQNVQIDERDDIGPLSPGNKRRRYNGDHPAVVNRAMPPRYGIAPPGVQIGPGTPFPFSTPPQHRYPPIAVHVRRDSLPGLRGMVSPPGPMAPPPRPGVGYQQHRLSQGHVTADRSLTLPPIQVGHVPNGGEVAVDSSKSTEEHITVPGFRYKIRVLSQVAPPVRKTEGRRGPLIAIEGDSEHTTKHLAVWLRDILAKEDDLAPTLLDGPDGTPQGSKEQMMAQYHRLVADWLGKSKSILESITVVSLDASVSTEDAPMSDVGHGSAHAQSHDNATGIDPDKESSSNAGDDRASSRGDSASAQEKMDIDNRSSIPSTTSTAATSWRPKPVSIVANYSLFASNRFATEIPIGGPDPYSPHDHWQWAATQWRGIIGPDLTIYIRDTVMGEGERPSLEVETVEGKPDLALFVVRRSKDDKAMADGEGETTIQLEAPVLRRIGFEVSEWVKAFGSRDSKA